MLKESATGPSQRVDVMANGDAMSESSRLCTTGSCHIHTVIYWPVMLSYLIFLCIKQILTCETGLLELTLSLQHLYFVQSSRAIY